MFRADVTITTDRGRKFDAIRTPARITKGILLDDITQTVFFSCGQPGDIVKDGDNVVSDGMFYTGYVPYDQLNPTGGLKVKTEY